MIMKIGHSLEIVKLEKDKYFTATKNCKYQITTVVKYFTNYINPFQMTRT